MLECRPDVCYVETDQVSRLWIGLSLKNDVIWHQTLSRAPADCRIISRELLGAEKSAMRKRKSALVRPNVGLVKGAVSRSGYSAVRVRELANISQPTWDKLEAGEHISIIDLRRLARLLRVDFRDSVIKS